MKVVGIVLVLTLALVPLSMVVSAQRVAQGQQWVLLGTKNVTDRSDHDSVAVGQNQGEFSRIKLAVGRSAVNFQRVVIHYRNGGDQDVELRDNIRAGGETRAIDLRADDRNIRSIEFWYEANSLGRRGATVRAFGIR
jgi:hypothetical protein